MTKRIKLLLLLLVALGVSGSIGHARPKHQTVQPDFRKGERVTGKDNTLALGATGAYGEIWAAPNAFNTDGATQIYITKVDTDTPADGVLKEGDVVLGVVSPRTSAGAKKLFANNARRELSAAITAAETKKNRGVLVLNVWHGGKEREAQLTLRVMGEFSKTSPRKCKKTEEIIRRACDYLEKRGFFQVNGAKERKPNGSIHAKLDALGLLATGNKRYLPMIQEYARAIGPKDVSLDINARMMSWNWAYTVLFLEEYYLATKDDSVLPAIKEYATKIAMGQSGAGTWGHSMAMPAVNNGELHGPPCGYGSMNQIGLTCALTLVMAQKCGVNNDEIEQAVKKATEFLRFYVDLGALPYGDHGPWGREDDNGKNSQAAVLFDLMGDKEAASYFSQTTIASYRERERGHTGHFFSMQWGALGASRAGDDAASSFIKEMRWYYELERRPDGNFLYQRQLANADHNKYINWSTTGSRLLHYCLPRKQLYITGKEKSVARKISGRELASTVAAGRPDYLSDRSAKELLKLLGSWSPTVRDRAGQALAKCEEDVVDELMAMLKSRNRYARYGACKGLRFAGRGSEEAVRAIIKYGLRSEDLTMRWFALDALNANNEKIGLGAATHLAVPELVKMGIADYPDESREWTKIWVCNALCSKYGVFKNHPDSFARLGRDLRVKLISSLLTVQDGRARGSVGNLYSKLDAKDLERLWGPIYQATKVRAPSGTMFADGIRARGIELMAKHGVEEGMELSLSILNEDRWGRYGRKMQIIPALKPYGGAAKKHLEELTKLGGDLVAINKRMKEALDAIENEESPKLISIAEYINQDSLKRP